MNDEHNAPEWTSDRAAFLARAAALGVSMTAAGTLLAEGAFAAKPKEGNRNPKSHYKMVMIQIQPHTVPTGWFAGIKEVTDVQNNIDVRLLNPNNNPATQIQMLNTAINQGVDAIFLQPADSVGVGPSIKKAAAKGIPVITLNIDANQSHAAHVTMNHYYDAMAIAQAMGKQMGGKGKAVILNAPPGIIIRDLRNNGFVDGMKKYWPKIQIVANQVADWDRKKAHDVFSTLLAGNKGITGVYGVNDSMALGAVDVAKEKGLVGKIAIWGNDGEKDALEAIQAGQLSGTAYTDVWQQGRLAAAFAIGAVTGGVKASSFKYEGSILMPYTIVTKANAHTIPPSQRW